VLRGEDGNGWWDERKESSKTPPGLQALLSAAKRERREGIVCVASSTPERKPISPNKQAKWEKGCKVH
jgi:hypothetical protein